MRKRQAEAAQLEALAQQIYERARAILEKEWFLLRDYLLACLKRKVEFRENRAYAIAPTVTSVSRQTLFAGRMPANFPDTALSTTADAGHWQNYWVNRGRRRKRVAYLNLKMAGDFEELQKITDSNNEVLAPNHYCFNARLLTAEPTFPLLVYSWLRSDLGSYQITPSEFGEQPAFYFLDTGGLPGYFQEFNSVFWVVERRMGMDRVALKYARIESFEEALLDHLRSTREAP